MLAIVFMPFGWNVSLILKGAAIEVMNLAVLLFQKSPCFFV